jgi:MoaA/NifB/PqqE/SkfB family radical SAM enzyme
MGVIAPREKLLWHPDRLTELRRDGKTSAPINVEIDLSNRCSLGCEWCHFAYTHTRGPLKGKRDKPAGAVLGGDLMDFDLAIGILNQLEEAGARSITWTGGGEPTLHPDFSAIVYACSRRKLKQGLYTHGGHITDAMAARLKSSFTFVYVSLDAADAESYKRAKGVDRFAAACEGVRKLAKAVGNATIGCGFLLTEGNWRDAPKMAALAKDLGADYAQFRPTILYAMDNPGEPSEDTSWLDEAFATTIALAQDPFVSVDVERFRNYRNWQGHGYATCWWSMLQTCITPNGKVWTCVNKREHPAAEIGDLSRETFQEIWQRHTAAKVTGDCRLMCRGHLPNQTLNDLMSDRPHMEFV